MASCEWNHYSFSSAIHFHIYKTLCWIAGGHMSKNKKKDKLKIRGCSYPSSFFGKNPDPRSSHFSVLKARRLQPNGFNRGREAQKCGWFMGKGFVLSLQTVSIHTLPYLSWQKIGGEIFKILLGPKGWKADRLLRSEGAETRSDGLSLQNMKQSAFLSSVCFYPFTVCMLTLLFFIEKGDMTGRSQGSSSGGR